VREATSGGRFITAVKLADRVARCSPRRPSGRLQPDASKSLAARLSGIGARLALIVGTLIGMRSNGSLNGWCNEIPFGNLTLAN
jgi:hypothetical protein